MSGEFAIASFLARWSGVARFDLSGSDAQTLPLADLLALASPDDRARWERLDFGYACPHGAPWLRETIARRHRAVGAEGIVCCAGAQEAVSSVARALLHPGDHAIVVLPIYQPSEDAVTSLCDATGVPLDDADWELDVDRVAAAIRPNTRLVLTNFPNSPTGAVLDPERFAALVSLCRRHGIWLVNDEVYRQTELQPDVDLPPMVADAYERGVSINGLSKGFGLPGLRIGWSACRDLWLRDRIVAAKSQMSTCISSGSEVLAHIALRAQADILSRTCAIGRRNRQRLQGLLARCGESFVPDRPRNCAFAFPRYIGPGSAQELAERLVRDAGVLVSPSSLWASPLGWARTDHVRINLGHAGNGAGLDRLEQAMSARAEAALEV